MDGRTAGGIGGSKTTTRRDKVFTRFALIPALLAGLLSVFACSRGVNSPQAPLVIISVDTLRADHLPAYGYRAVATPNLDALARDSLVFENALSHVPLTLPSHASLFTGLLPFEHGVRDNLGYRLARTHETLSAFLRRHGYTTGGAVSAIVLDHCSGIAEGFDFYEDSIESRDVAEAVSRVRRRGDATAKLLEDWIAGVSAKPFFAFLHLYEPHAPYDPPEPFRSRYASNLYDGVIASADAITGRFLGFLKERHLYDRSVIVFLSDHGEGLGEHGEDEHGILLYREAVHVPLFLKLPDSTRAGERVASPAAIADVFPTVVKLLSLPPPQSRSGRSLLDLDTAAPRRIYSETLYPRYHFGWSDLAALTDDRYHYIEAPSPEIYDWRADPGERRDLSSGLPPAFRSMRLVLAGMKRPLQAPGAEDPETVRKLASLGYIGAARPAETSRNLPDPKARVGTIDLLKEANRLVSKHRDDKAITILRKLAAENPLMLDAWEELSRILRRAGRPREALQALAQADQLSPTTPQILLGMADLCRENGDFARARTLAQAAGTAGGRGMREEIASIALDEGHLDEAWAEAEAAHRENPRGLSEVQLLARVALARGEAAAALSLLDSAPVVSQRENGPPIRGLEGVRGDALARLKREKEAEAAFRAEISAFPENLDAWSRLALLYASEGREREFRQLLLELDRRVPTARARQAAAQVSEIVGDRAGARDWRRRAAERR